MVRIGLARLIRAACTPALLVLVPCHMPSTGISNLIVVLWAVGVARRFQRTMDTSWHFQILQGYKIMQVSRKRFKGRTGCLQGV